MRPDRFLRRAIYAAALLVVVVSLIVLGALGLLGTGVRDSLWGAWKAIDGILEQNDKSLDRAWKVLGAIGTVVSISWGIYKSWYYAERNLPLRLEEFLRRNDDRLKQARGLLVQTIEGPKSRQSQRLPIALVGPLNDALHQIRYGKVDYAEADLASSIDLLKKQREHWSKFDRHSLDQLVAAHLLKGIILAAQASMKSGASGREQDVAAFDEFDAAHQLAPNDSEILYYRARQSMRLNQFPMANEDLNKAIGLTEEGKSIIRARILYASAQVRSKHVNPSWSVAQATMKQAVDSLPDTFRNTLESAEMHEFRGEAQEKVGSSNAAVASYSAAERIYSNDQSLRARDGFARVAAALKRLGT